jgi:hypothetical protein
VCGVVGFWRRNISESIPLLCSVHSAWLIDVTDGYVVSIGAYSAFTYPCYAFSGSLVYSSVHRGTM